MILCALLFFGVNTMGQDSDISSKVVEKLKIDIYGSLFSLNKNTGSEILDRSLRLSVDYMINEKYAIKLCGGEFINFNTKTSTYHAYATYGIGLGVFLLGNQQIELALKLGGIHDNVFGDGFFYEVGTKFYFTKSAYCGIMLNHQFLASDNLFSMNFGFGIRLF